MIKSLVTLFSLDTFKLKDRLAKITDPKDRTAMMGVTIVSDVARLLIGGAIILALVA